MGGATRKCLPHQARNPDTGRCRARCARGTTRNEAGRCVRTSAIASKNASDAQNAVITRMAKRKGAEVIVTNVVPDPGLPAEAKAKERSYIRRAKDMVADAFAKARGFVSAHKFKVVGLLVLVIALTLLHVSRSTGEAERKLIEILKGTSALPELNRVQVLKDTLLTTNAKGRWVAGGAMHAKYAGSLAADMCKYTPELCKSGAMPRNFMPQVDVLAFLGSMGRMPGVSVFSKQMPAEMLKPVQKELLWSKVAGISKGLNTDAKADAGSIVAAKIGGEYFVIDGHHRWAAAWASGKNVTAHIVDMGAAKPGALQMLLGYALSAAGTTFAGL